MKLFTVFLIIVFQTTTPTIKPGKYSGSEKMMRHAHWVDLNIKKNGTYKCDEKITSIGDWEEKGTWSIKNDTLILTPTWFKHKLKKQKEYCQDSKKINCKTKYYYISEDKLYLRKYEGKYINQLNFK